MKKTKKEEPEYEMKKSDAVSEHRRLIKVLESANNKLQKDEAKLQRRELKGILKLKED